MTWLTIVNVVVLLTTIAIGLNNVNRCREHRAVCEDVERNVYEIAERAREPHDDPEPEALTERLPLMSGEDPQLLTHGTRTLLNRAERTDAALPQPRGKHHAPRHAATAPH